MSDLTVHAATLTDVGKARELNEDSLFAGAHVFAVADGLGGHRAGEVASNIVVESLQSLDGHLDSNLADALATAVRKANREVFQRQQANADLRGMGTTITALAIDGSVAHLAHVGDSRCYLIRDGAISQVSQDHTLVARMVAEGKLTPEQAEYHPQRSILTRALGAAPDIDVDTLELELSGGDRLVLCSDGLTAVISDDEILGFVARARDLDDACKALVDEANARGGPDNISVVLLDVTGPRRRVSAVVESEPSPAPLPAAASKRPPARRKFPVRLAVWIAVVLVAVIGGWIGVRAWVDGSWYVGVDGNTVAVFRGLPTDALGGVLHRVEEPAQLTLDEVAPFYRNRLREGLRVAGIQEARDLIDRIPRMDASSPGASPTSSPTPSSTPS